MKLETMKLTIRCHIAASAETREVCSGRVEIGLAMLTLVPTCTVVVPNRQIELHHTALRYHRQAFCEALWTNVVWTMKLLYPSSTK